MATSVGVAQLCTYVYGKRSETILAALKAKSDLRISVIAEMKYGPNFCGHDAQYRRRRQLQLRHRVPVVARSGRDVGGEDSA
jgi:hypothetical protein